MKRIGILTGGGDTAALNAIIYGAAVKADQEGIELIGFKRGWQGLLDKPDYMHVTTSNVISSRGGTILRSSRVNPSYEDLDKVADNLERMVDSLIAIGGDDTLSVASRLRDRTNTPICFVTKTIDNDVGSNAWGHEIDFEQIRNYFNAGFPTAAAKASSYALDLRTTAYSHERIMFLETMGRTPGWLALGSYAGNPDFILVPEVGLDYPDFLKKLADKYAKQGYAVVVVAEGLRYKNSDTHIAEDKNTRDRFGHTKLGGVADILAKKVGADLKIENCNAVDPSYLYRSGPPSTVDENRGIETGAKAFEGALKGYHNHIVSLQRIGDKIVPELKMAEQVVSFSETGTLLPRTLDNRFYNPTEYNITPIGREYFRPIIQSRGG